MLNETEVVFKPLGESVLLIEWPGRIDREILMQITRYQTTIEKAGIKGVVEAYPAYQSMAVAFDPEEISFDTLKRNLQKLTVQKYSLKRYRWFIPVCYEKAPDMAAFAKAKGLTPKEVILLHSSVIYTVHFIGFLPGFMYLGGLDERLHLSRKSNPDRSVPKGSVAIGGSQTGIYPVESPGGWHVIGNSPVRFFDPKTDPPCFASPGDEIIFEAVDGHTRREISMKIAAGTYSLQKEKIHG